MSVVSAADDRNHLGIRCCCCCLLQPARFPSWSRAAARGGWGCCGRSRWAAGSTSAAASPTAGGRQGAAALRGGGQEWDRPPAQVGDECSVAVPGADVGWAPWPPPGRPFVFGVAYRLRAISIRTEKILID
jgi:hypothetical protein